MTAERWYVPPMVLQSMTADELQRASFPDKRLELIRGVLVVREPAGGRHGRLAAALARLIGTHVHDRDLGVVYGAETGFTLRREPDTVRAPDVAFIRRDRVPAPEPVGFLPFAPDLAVEVLSPGDTPGETLAKVADWLDAGTRLIWVIDPERRQARVYRADGTESSFGDGDELGGEDVLPGFILELSTLF
jgi:Uma2 family endonuclease